MSICKSRATGDITGLTSSAAIRAILCLLPLWLMAGCADHTVSDSHIVGINHYIDGAMAYEKGDTSTAQSELTAAVTENPNLTMAQIILGDIYRSKSDFRDACDHYQAAARLDPYEARNHYNLGLVYQFLNRLQEAAGSYLTAMKLEPRDADSTMNLGLVYLDLNQPDQALAMMNKAVQIAPDNAAAHCNLGVALETHGDLPGAEREYTRAFELDENLTMAVSDLAENLVRQKRGKEAIPFAQRLLKKSDTPAHRRLYADALALAGRDDDAYRQYDVAWHLDPKDWRSLNQAAMILIRKYQAGLTLDETLRTHAVAIWKKSLEIEPDQPELKALIDKWNQGGKVTP